MNLQTIYYFSSFSELANTATGIRSWFILFPLIIFHTPDSTPTDNQTGKKKNFATTKYSSEKCEATGNNEN
jgi:hypothetical protein